MGNDILVEMNKISKKFGVVKALDDISFKVERGQVHVLLGENGAGKSTLMKILSGVYQPSSGSIILKGREYSELTPFISSENKISIIYQELSVINELSILENLFIGKLPTKKIAGIFSVVDFEYMREIAKNILDKIGLKKEPETLVESLTIGEKQQVEIAKALVSDSEIIIMDKPTTSLTESEVNNLFRIINQLKSEGKGIVYISHKLKELKEIGDIVTVLKDGKSVGTFKIKDIEIKDLVTMMVGREVKLRYNSNNKGIDKNDVIFEVKNLSRSDGKIKNISFKINRGEILGFAGLVGSGRSELMEAIFGVVPIKHGDISMYGEHSIPKNEYDSIKKSMGFITENRRETGFFHNFNIKENISIVPFIKLSKFKGMFGLLNSKLEEEYAIKSKKQLNIKCDSINQNICELSGGNQQKVILSKWMMANSNLMIFDEPTKGIDIGSKSEIYTIIRELSDDGKIIMMVSSELPELLAVCDKIAVFKNGQIIDILPIKEATEEKIMKLLTSEEEVI